MSDGVRLIAAERQRQVEVEGYDSAHDDEHREELARAGAAYALSEGDVQGVFALIWPWSMRAWKPTGDRIRDLTKAGALIAAALDAELRARDR